MLEPVQRDRLACLFGPEDANLMQVKLMLNVQFAYSGGHIHIEV